MAHNVYEIIPDPGNRAMRILELNFWAGQGYRLRHIYSNGDHLLERVETGTPDATLTSETIPEPPVSRKAKGR